MPLYVPRMCCPSSCTAAVPLSAGTTSCTRLRLLLYRPDIMYRCCTASSLQVQLHAAGPRLRLLRLRLAAGHLLGDGGSRPHSHATGTLTFGLVVGGLVLWAAWRMHAHAGGGCRCCIPLHPPWFLSPCRPPCRATRQTGRRSWRASQSASWPVWAPGCCRQRCQLVPAARLPTAAALPGAAVAAAAAWQAVAGAALPAAACLRRPASPWIACQR